MIARTHYTPEQIDEMRMSIRHARAGLDAFRRSEIVVDDIHYADINAALNGYSTLIPAYVTALGPRKVGRKKPHPVEQEMTRAMPWLKKKHPRSAQLDGL